MVEIKLVACIQVSYFNIAKKIENMRMKHATGKTLQMAETADLSFGILLHIMPTWPA